MTMITDDIVAAYNRSKWALVLRGLVGIALGVLIITRPLASVAAFALVIALWAVIDGIVNVVHSFDLRAVVKHWWIMLVSGIVSLGFGVAALYYYPALSLTFAVLWSAWWLIAGGTLGVYVAIEERKVNLPWGWTMAFGVVALAAGVLALVYPGLTLAALMGMLAAFGLVGGLVMLIGAAKLQTFQHDVKHALRTPARA